jgi:hypothetical protein
VKPLAPTQLRTRRRVDTTRRGKHRSHRPRLHLETFEERTLPATFDVSAGTASYAASASAASRVTLVLGESALLVTDPAEIIVLTGAAKAAGCTSVGLNSIRCPAAAFSLVEVGVAGGSDMVTVRQAGGTATVNVRSADAAVDLIVDDRENSTPRTAFLAGDTLAGLGPASVTFVGSQIRTLTVRGGGGGNAFTIANDGGFPTVLESGTGQDVVNVHRTSAALAVNGQDGRDVVIVGRAPPRFGTLVLSGKPLSDIQGTVTVRNDRSATDLAIVDGARVGGVDFVVDAGRVRTSRSADIEYAAADLASLTIQVTAGGNSFTVGATARELATTLTSGPGDRVRVQHAAGGPVRIVDADASARVTGVGAPRVEHIISRGPLALGRDTAGVLAATSDTDRYALRVSEPGLCSVRLVAPAGSPLDGRLTLSGPQSYLTSAEGLRIGGGGLLVESDDRAFGDRTSALSVFLIPGSYDLSVAAAGAAPGAYTLTPTFTPGVHPFVERSGPQLDLNPAQNRVVGDNPHGLLTADLNRDGILDLATVNRDSGDVSVLLGVGDLSFEGQLRFAVGGRPTAIVTLDFNTDGRIDLAVRDSALGVVTILPGIGDGTFSVTDTIRRPAGAPDVIGLFPAGSVRQVVGDFNRDGAPDRAALVPLTPGDPARFVNRVETFIGLPSPLPGLIDTPTGPFAIGGLLEEDASDLFIPARTFTPSPTRATPQFADFNGDGVLDIVTVSRAGDILVRAGRRGQPGTFDPPTPVNSGNAPRARAVTVVPGGPRPRLAAVNLVSDSVTLYEQRPNGVWVATGQLSTGRTPQTVVAADLDGDGRSDLVVGNNLFTFASLSLYLGEAGGGFTQVGDVKVGTAISDVLASDLNRDGRPDLVVTNADSGTVGVLMNRGMHRGAIAFEVERRPRAGTGLSGVIETGASVLVTALVREQSDLPDLLPPLYEYVANEETRAAAVGDFNGDGVTDVVAANRGTGTLGVLLGKTGPAGGLTDPRVLAAGVRPSAVSAADLNGDGKLDLAVLDTDADTVSVFLGDGRGGFTPLFAGGAGNRASGLSVADVDGDGDRDLAVGNDFGDVLFVLGNGKGGFGAFVRSDRRVPFVAADFNRDGAVDVVVADQARDQAGAQLRLPGGRSFTPGAFQQQGDELIGPGAVALAELDGLYGTDLVFANTGSNNVLIYLRRPDGGFADAPRSYFAGTGPVGLAVSQLNDDNGDAVVDGRDRPDLVVANQGSNDVSVLFGSTDTGGQWSFRFGPRLETGGSGPNAVATRDQTGDGIPDLLVSNGLSGTLAVLPGVANLGVGTGFFRDADLQLFPLSDQFIGQALFPPGSSAGFAVTRGGGIIGIDLDTLRAAAVAPAFARFVTAIDSFTAGDTTFLAAATTDGIALLAPDVQGVYVEQALLTDAALSDPSALTVLRTGNGFEVYVTTAGEAVPLVLPLNSAVLGISPPDGGVGTAAVGDNPLALVVLVTALTGFPAESESGQVGEVGLPVFGGDALVEYAIGAGGEVTGVGEKLLNTIDDLDAEDGLAPPEPPPDGATELERFISGSREALRELGWTTGEPRQTPQDVGGGEVIDDPPRQPVLEPSAAAAGQATGSGGANARAYPHQEFDRLDTPVTDRANAVDPVGAVASHLRASSWVNNLLGVFRPVLMYVAVPTVLYDLIRGSVVRQTEDRIGGIGRGRLGAGMRWSRG